MALEDRIVIVRKTAHGSESLKVACHFPGKWDVADPVPTLREVDGVPVDPTPNTHDTLLKIDIAPAQRDQFADAQTRLGEESDERLPLIWRVLKQTLEFIRRKCPRPFALLWRDGARASREA